MDTVKVQWHAAQGQWLISLADGTTLTLEQWAATVPDLTAVRMLLAAPNYAVHWLSLVGVSQRHIAKVLPFALEESLIEDVNHYQIVPAGSAKKHFRAYVVSKDLIERLLEACAMHHLRVGELIPETWLLESDNQCVRSGQGWLFSWPALFEGWVPDAALTPVLEAILTTDVRLEKLSIKASSLDQINLFKSSLETSFSGQIGEFDSQIINHQLLPLVPAKAINLLAGQYQPRTPKEQKPPLWWKPLAGLAAAWLMLWTLILYSDVSTLNKQAAEVQSQSLALYKQLFPNERIRSLERQFKEKLSGGGSVRSGSFLTSTQALAKAYHSQNLSGKVELLSLRFNDRLQETTLEVKAASLNELQALRQALEDAGLQAEIASATNDKDGVKGRVRIGVSA